MTDLKNVFKNERVLVDDRIDLVLKNAGDLPMYHMLRYFMGFSNDLQQPTSGTHGKRTRSALLLLIAEMFGGAKSALDLAAAVELFHNFTLIHDDIVDNDEMRRGQPTVWKQWGVDHAINSGDAQLLLTNKCLLHAIVSDPVNGVGASELLNNYFLEVCEGQYLDFELTKKRLDDQAVTKEAYLEMIRKKTAVLVGAASAAAGKATGTTDEVTKKLFTYGEQLGMAYQIVDDYVSVWGGKGATGKNEYGDIIERKKTFPVLYTREHGNSKRLIELYEKTEVLTDTEISEVVALFEEAGADIATQKYAESHVENARDVVKSLPIIDESKQILVALVEKVVHVAGKIEKTT